jgi:hypothetical protein
METAYDRRYQRQEERRQKRLANQKIELLSKEEALSSMPEGSNKELWEMAVNSIFTFTNKAELKEILRMYKMKFKTALSIYSMYGKR